MVEKVRGREISTVLLPGTVYQRLDEIACNKDIAVEEVVLEALSSWVKGFEFDPEDKRRSPLKIV